MFDQLKAKFLALLIPLLPLFANAQSGVTGWQKANEWGGFDVDNAIRTVAQLPADILVLVRYATITGAIICYFSLFVMLGLSGVRQIRGHTANQQGRTLSFGQFLTGFSIAVALQSIAESLLIFRLSRGILQGEGQSVIEHPLGHVVASDPNYGWILLKVFVLNSTVLIGFLFVVTGFFKWYEVSIGKGQHRAREIITHIIIGSLFFSFETTYRIIATTLGLGDPLGILFNA